ncbi:MAG TPA: hypothetical protein VGS57_22830 [Thermoanaerobaculia bacterium]|jgi:2,4-dienoyl-CoA reductase-like NADH-dependent reductase (Old Yellow Enzyme family)|nr:hypothetical protein [Thermoanaerobaculia bacterium]
MPTLSDELAAVWSAQRTVRRSQSFAEQWAFVQHSLVLPRLGEAAEFLRQQGQPATIEAYIKGSRLRVGNRADTPALSLFFEPQAVDGVVVCTSSLADRPTSYPVDELTDDVVRSLIRDFVAAIARIAAISA